MKAIFFFLFGFWSAFFMWNLWKHFPEGGPPLLVLGAIVLAIFGGIAVAAE